MAWGTVDIRVMATADTRDTGMAEALALDLLLAVLVVPALGAGHRDFAGPLLLILVSILLDLAAGLVSGSDLETSKTSQTKKIRVWSTSSIDRRGFYIERISHLPF